MNQIACVDTVLTDVSNFSKSPAVTYAVQLVISLKRWKTVT